MKLIAILTFFSIIQLFARISAKETCPLVLGHRGAPGIYPEDTVILTKFLFNFENTSSSDQIPKPESTNPDFCKANLFVVINGFLFDRNRKENADDISCFFNQKRQFDAYFRCL